MNKRLVSRLVRLNRKVAWLLFLAAALVIFTGYGQSIRGFNREVMRGIHLIAEWFFIAFITYHVIVGTFLARYKYGSSLRRILRRKAGVPAILRFILRASSWPLLVVSAVVILAGLSYYGILTLSFNRHVEVDAVFFILFVLHTTAGASVAIKRRWSGDGGQGRDAGRAVGISRRRFVKWAGLLGLVIGAGAGYLLLRPGRKPGEAGARPNPGNGSGQDSDDFDRQDARPRQQGEVTVGNRVFTFDPRQVKTIRPDIFRTGFFSIFDVLVHLHDEGKITLEYHFDQDLNTNVIDRIDGGPGWWYQIYYSGGWPERSVFRPDHYPWKDDTTLRFFREDPGRLEAVYSEWRDETKRKRLAGNKLIIPVVYIRGRTFTKEFRNVEVVPHNMRGDMFQEGVVTGLDVIMSLGDQKQISYDLKWYESMGAAEIVKDYWVERVDADQAYGRCGYVYEAGSLKYRRFTGNHIHLPTPSRVLNSPEYVEFFWICI